MSDHFVTAQQAAESALLKMALRAILARSAADDAFVSAIRVEYEGDDTVSVELLDPSMTPVGGFTL